MLTGRIQINDFTLVDWQATNEGHDYQDCTIYRVYAQAYNQDHKRQVFDFDIFINQPPGPVGLGIRVMQEINNRLEGH